MTRSHQKYIPELSVSQTNKTLYFIPPLIYFTGHEGTVVYLRLLTPVLSGTNVISSVRTTALEERVCRFSLCNVCKSPKSWHILPNFHFSDLSVTCWDRKRTVQAHFYTSMGWKDQRLGGARDTPVFGFSKDPTSTALSEQQTVTP